MKLEYHSIPIQRSFHMMILPLHHSELLGLQLRYGQLELLLQPSYGQLVLLLQLFGQLVLLPLPQLLRTTTPRDLH